MAEIELMDARLNEEEMTADEFLTDLKAMMQK